MQACNRNAVSFRDEAPSPSRVEARNGEGGKAENREYIFSADVAFILSKRDVKE